MTTPTRPVLLLDERDAAASLGLQPRTLQLWRRTGEGPSFVRVSSRCVRYRVADLESWAESRVRTSTADTGP
jgi:predicted DNA-binding transcriptional regulator AlpA